MQVRIFFSIFTIPNVLQEHTFATISMLSGLSRVRVLQAIFDVGLPNREYCDSWKNLTGPGHPGGAGLPLQERLRPEDGLLLPGCPSDLRSCPHVGCPAGRD